MEKQKEDVTKTLNKINNMTQYEMVRLWRFAPAGHSYFNLNQPFHEVFKKRFKELGGMTPEISKRLGWE